MYSWERPQFEEMIPEDSNSQPSSFYGPYHLLRLFGKDIWEWPYIINTISTKNFFFLFSVKLGDMLSYTLFDEKSTQLLLKHFHHFLKYLSDNSSTLFNLDDYKDPLPDYHKKFSKWTRVRNFRRLYFIIWPRETFAKYCKKI